MQSFLTAFYRLFVPTAISLPKSLSMPIPYHSSQIGEKQEEFVSGLSSPNNQNVSVFLSSIQKLSHFSYQCTT